MTVSYGILGTYPPTQCGLATFSQALIASLRSNADQVEMIRVLDAAEMPAQTEHCWVREDAFGPARAAAALNANDVAIIQHEYGIYPGPDGEQVLVVSRALRVPIIVVLHTVLTTPTIRQRKILEELARHASVIVTMTRTARQRLIDHYTIDATRIRVIPHGAADTRPLSGAHAPCSTGEVPVVLTWGLLGPGKGIEWAIDAMPLLADLYPCPEYWVVGQTHPKVRLAQGENYRESLIKRAEGVGGSTHFEDRYLPTADLLDLVRRADVVLLPYDSQEQVTSGVLIEAVTAGRPVVSTGFPHAVELLSTGAGLIVNRQDPRAIAEALRRILTDADLALRMSTEAVRIAPDLLWSTVADRYRQIAIQLLAPRVAIA